MSSSTWLAIDAVVLAALFVFGFSAIADLLRCTPPNDVKPGVVFDDYTAEDMPRVVIAGETPPVVFFDPSPEFMAAMIEPRFYKPESVQHPDVKEAPLIVPGYWMNETSGVLHKAVDAHITGLPMTAEEFAYMRAYLKQWMRGNWHAGPTLDALRADLETMTTPAELDGWFERAEAVGIDPL